MHPIQFAKTTGAHFVAAWLAMVAVACDSPTVIPEPCPECKKDGAADGPRRDTPLPPDSPTLDSGMSRSPLCGTMGCFPGNPSACGPAPVPDAAFFARHMADDASDANDDAVTDGSSDASADAADAPGSADAKADTCDDASHDGSTQDVSIDTDEPDGAADAVNEPEPDAPPDAGEDADASPPPPADASAPDAGGPADAQADIGVSDEPKISQACYIKPAATGVVTECAPLGAGAPGSACNDSHECGALLACIEVDQKTACRPVSCGLPPLCLKGTYYEEAPLRVNGVTRRDLNVPVCLPADNCTLLAQPNPCPMGKVCAVVGSEGDTTCMDPGTGKVGEPCDESTGCEEGLLCSKFAGQCVKICRVDPTARDCPTGTCQGGNRSLPDGFGICVGQTDSGY